MRNWSNVRALIDTLHGRWVVAILHNLRDGPKRPKDLRDAISMQSPDGPIAPKVLIETLTLMCERGLLVREELSAVPRVVEYSLTHWGRILYQATDTLEEWSALDPRDDAAEPVGCAESGAGAAAHGGDDTWQGEDCRPSAG